MASIDEITDGLQVTGRASAQVQEHGGGFFRAVGHRYSQDLLTIVILHASDLEQFS